MATIADFRSDLMSGIPHSALQAMLQAAGGLPEMGFRDDPFQLRLEREVAELAGFEDALFVPTCTLANQIALRLWCRPGDTVLAASDSHVASSEAASTAGLAGVAVRRLEAVRGHPSPAAVQAALAQPQGSGSQPARLAWLENTQMRAGGTLLPDGWGAAIGALCRDAGRRVHLDGSRLWNAEVATGQPLAALAQGVDSLALSLNKALGAPAGSLLLGPRDFIREAVAVRGTLGGAWRPVGFLAAAAIEALNGRTERLRADHESARHLHGELAEAFGPLAGEAPDTNIVLLTLPAGSAASEIVDRLRRKHVLALALDEATLRFVTHARIDDEAVAQAVDAVQRALSAAPEKATPP